MEKKETKTNAMRMLDKAKIKYTTQFYECEQFVDAVAVADSLHQDYDQSFKTLVTVGKSGEHYVFVLPIAMELDLKVAAKSVGEKSVELIAVKDITKVTGYIRGGCSPLGMKKPFVTVIDESAQLFDQIIISGGSIGAQIFINPDDLVSITHATYAPIAVESL